MISNNDLYSRQHESRRTGAGDDIADNMNQEGLVLVMRFYDVLHLKS